MVCSTTGFCTKHLVECKTHRKHSITSEAREDTPAPAAAAPGETRVGVVRKMRSEPDQPAEDKPEKPIFDDQDDQDDSEEEEQYNVEELKDAATQLAEKVVIELLGGHEVSHVEFLAHGGYNHVWLVTFSSKLSKDGRQPGEDQKLVLRIAKNTPSLRPYQLRHEVACLKFLEKHLPRIPAPRVYACDDGTSNSGPAFIAEEYIEGERLSVVWPRLTEQQKSDITKEIANVVADLGETRFSFIGGLALDSEAGPTIEAAKVFNGRTKFHSPDCYDIGPYTSSKDYVLSCYDREIYYYTHASRNDIIQEAFEETSVEQFVKDLKLERQGLANDEASFRAIDAEPRVLVHEDFRAGNMLVRDGHLVGVVDWEFSGVYPLSELLGAISILQISGPDRDESTEAEEDEWHERYLQQLEDVVRERGWSEQDIAAALSGGHSVLGKARSVMFPESMDEQSEKDSEERV